MKKNDHFLTEEIEIPDIVMQKAEAAFRQIKMEDEKQMSRKLNRKKSAFFRSQTAAAACICVLGIGAVTAAAAVIHHYWGRGMQGTLQAAEEQQQELVDQGNAVVFSDLENYSDMAVTDGGVTITPETVITDGKCAHVSFIVKGFTIGEDAEPGFEVVKTYLEDDEEPVNMGGSFYDGIVADETGGPVYDDGSRLEYTEDGRTITHYVDADGNLEYVVSASTADPDGSLLGKVLHVDFEDLGTLYKAECTVATEGEWKFAIPLPEVSAAKEIQVSKEVPGTVFTMDSISLSPISIKVNYTVNGDVESNQDDNGVPEFCGVVLQDGKRLPYLFNGGGSGYTDESMTAAYSMSSFDRVIEVEQVKSILVRTETGSELVEVPIG